MFGAVIGDMAGSLYEYDEFMTGDSKRLEILTKSKIIDDDCFYSDDTILTIAILKAILTSSSYEDKLREYGLKYYKLVPNETNYFKYMFSPGFVKWCHSESGGISIGNGAMMRISPVAYMFDDYQTIQRETYKATIPSHNSTLAISSAQKVSQMIYYGRKGVNKEEFLGRSNLTLDQLQEDNKFDGTCYVLDKCLAVLALSESFEDAVRKAVSLGGDTDTIGAIVGSMAEAMYGVPDDLKQLAIEKFSDDFVSDLEQGYQMIKSLE